MHIDLQIDEVRLRLNLDVIVAPDSPPAPAPIESFTDMVTRSTHENWVYCNGIKVFTWSDLVWNLLVCSVCILAL